MEECASPYLGSHPARGNMGLCHLHLGNPVFLVVEPGLAWPAAGCATGQADQQPDPWPAATPRRATPGTVRGSATHGTSSSGYLRQASSPAAPTARLAAPSPFPLPRDAHPLLQCTTSSPTQTRYSQREVTLQCIKAKKAS